MRPLVLRLLGLAWRHRVASLILITLQLLLALGGLGSLGLVGVGIDVMREALETNGPHARWPFGLEPPSGWSPFQKILLVAGMIAVVALATALLKFLTAVASARLSASVVVRLRTEVYDKLQRLSFRFFDTHDSSSIINRATGDVQAVRQFIDGVLVKMITVAMTMAVYTWYMASLHLTLTAVCLFTTPFLCASAVWFSRATRKLYTESGELQDKMVQRLSENIQGVHVVKGFAREDEEVDRFRAANEKIRDQKYRIFWTLSIYQPLTGLLTQLNMVALISYGSYLVIIGELPLGTGLFVFANLLHEFANQVGQITMIANSIQASLTGAERVFEIIDAPVEIQSKSNAYRPERVLGRIEFENVSFGYKPDQTVLDGVSFTVEPGEILGIVGETGAGKTTVLQLLERFYDVGNGSVRIDGRDLRDWDVAALRTSIGVVFQESFLFSNTVASNIAFGNPEATRERVELAARLAAAHNFISELPNGYQNMIGEHGANLSGGQRQRLSIARALLLDPPILVMDDATAAVDAETEHEIQEAIESSSRGRTTILVSSRVSTLRRADRVILLQKGRVVESGTHEELMELGGEYHRLCELQSQGHDWEAALQGEVA